jgi:predicted nucleotidyltransferase
MFNVGYLEQNPKASTIVTDIPYLKNPDFLCIIGSKLYGTENKDSDLDIRGFTFLPKEFLLGVSRFDQHENTTSGDIVVWSAEKFVNMLLKGSSVAFEMLFCPDTHIIRKSDYANELVKYKTLFISQRVIKAALGYAQSEWRKVVGETTRDLGERRKKDIEQYGYSCRNASHAIRILDSFYDLGKYGYIKFPCNGHTFLRAVKEGNVDFKDVEGIYTQSLEKLESVLSTVPKKQDIKKVNKLLVSLNLKRLLLSELESIYNSPV